MERHTLTVPTEDGRRRGLPHTRVHTLVIGSGAAGLNAAVQLRRHGVDDVLILTEGLHKGTSINTGSDKQTYYKLAMCGDDADSPRAMAETYFAGGSMHGDLALVEASLSARAFLHLVNLGVPFPRDAYGQFVGYKTGPRSAPAGHLDRALHLAGDVPGPDPRGAAAAASRCARGGTSSRCSPSSDGRRAPRRGRAGAERPRADWRSTRRRTSSSPSGGPGGLYKTSVYPGGPHRRHRPGAAGRRPGAEPAGVAVRPGLDRVPLERVGHLHAGRSPLRQHRGRRHERRAGVSARRTSTSVGRDELAWCSSRATSGRSTPARSSAARRCRHPGLHRDGGQGAARVPGLPARTARASRFDGPQPGGPDVPDQVAGPAGDAHRAGSQAMNPAARSSSTASTASTSPGSRWRSPSAPSTTTAVWRRITGGKSVNIRHLFPGGRGQRLARRLPARRIGAQLRPGGRLPRRGVHRAAVCGSYAGGRALRAGRGDGSGRRPALERQVSRGSRLAGRAPGATAAHDARRRPHPAGRRPWAGRGGGPRPVAPPGSERLPGGPRRSFPRRGPPGSSASPTSSIWRRSASPWRAGPGAGAPRWCWIRAGHRPRRAGPGVEFRSP